jgi:hypothetical protein
MISNGNIPSSFRDPSGFVFWQDGSIFRQVNKIYQEHYDHLISSGLYETLVASRLLVSHDEVEPKYGKTDNAYKVLKVEPVSFISYPYEWCFSQLKDAALTTLEIQKTALDFGMTLKDSSAYNIQFVKGKPVLIDTLSFEKYQEGQIWVAYRQFCQHFLAPLALMSYTDVRLNQLSRVYIDGVPLDLASSLLPTRTWLKPSLLSHIHLHAKSQKRFADKSINKDSHKMSRLGFMGLIDNLETAVKRLRWITQNTEWADYYGETNYSPEGLNHKKQLVAEFIAQINPKFVWDLGANTGLFSRIASEQGIQTISFDIDPAAVEQNYIECLQTGETNMLPFLLDLTNPSPNIGWENRERTAFMERGPVDTVLALALIHHLAISNNLPLKKIADFFNKICNSLIIEFVPKHDSQVQRLLSSREDIFPDYCQETFENEFRQSFTIRDSAKLNGSERTLYFMQNRETR